MHIPNSRRLIRQINMQQETGRSTNIVQPDLPMKQNGIALDEISVDKRRHKKSQLSVDCKLLVCVCLSSRKHC